MTEEEKSIDQTQDQPQTDAAASGPVDPTAEDDQARQLVEDVAAFVDHPDQDADDAETAEPGDEKAEPALSEEPAEETESADDTAAQTSDPDQESDDQDTLAPPLHIAAPDGAEVTPRQIVEAILFTSDAPLSPAKIASAVGAIGSRDVREIIDQLNADYAAANMSFRVEQIAGGYQMMTRPEYAVYLQEFYKVRSESRLSTAALETLAVVAYKQPVLRAEIEAIRGVACGEVLRSLMEKGLVKIVGRAEELGRPMLYGSIKRFLEIFGLHDLKDLPKVPELVMPHRDQPKPTDQQPAPTEPAAETATEPSAESETPAPAAEPTEPPPATEETPEAQPEQDPPTSPIE